MENKFKVGEKVKLIDEDKWYHLKTALVISIDRDNFIYWVKVDGKDYAFSENNLQKLKPPKSSELLPKKWYVRITDFNKDKCENWLRENNPKFNRFLDSWPDADLLLSKHRKDASMFYCGGSLPYDYNGYQEITIEQLLNSKQPKETMKTQKISREGLGELYQIVCNNWQEKITSIIMTDKFASEFEVDEKLIKQAYDEANEDHLKVLNKYFKKPKKLVKREMVKWVNVYPNGGQSIYHTEQEANQNAGKERIACVELKGSYEVYE